MTSSPTNFSKEPRPVYAPELDILGFNEFLKYDAQDKMPYMWAEANSYFYRGILIAKTLGGNLYNAPKLILTPDGESLTGKLEPVNIGLMCEKNKKIMSVIERDTVKRILNVYEDYAKKVDIFYVAFSGGKDSTVLLDLVKKTLPVKSFAVVFGDTEMEFPDTYKAIEFTKSLCESEGIPFYIARSHFEPVKSWHMFGPPSRMLRWCCSVHKNAPQVLMLREILGRKNYTGFAFVGVRAEESAARSKYKFLNLGEELNGQYSHNSILNWTSAEVWLYIFSNNLFINEAYKKGMGRAGCLLCPMGGGRNDFFQASAYHDNVNALADVINSMNERCAGNYQALREYICNGGWNARKNGRDLKRDDDVQYLEERQGSSFIIKIHNPRTDWHEWIKTLGILPFNFEQSRLIDGVEIRCDNLEANKDPALFKKFRYVFKKSAYCLGCRVCEANCPNGCISFKNGLEIKNCVHCGSCLELDEGCIAYRSLRRPYEGTSIMKGKSINQFSNHAPKSEWMKEFFTNGNNFWDINSLGPEQVRRFKLFLRLAGIIDDKYETTELFNEILRHYDWNNETVWGLIYVNLAYNSSQIQWYISSMKSEHEYSRIMIYDMLEAEGLKKDSIASVISAFKRLCELPLGKIINFGHVNNEIFSRTECIFSDDRIFLYALYNFSEKCNLDKEFNLSYLFDDEIERDALSPVQIFGFHDEGKIRSKLLGLSAMYQDFINVTFTNDLQSIMLRDKTPQDVLLLFRND